MQFALIFCAIIIISFSASHAHPASEKCNEPTTTERARPIQQFFNKVLNALRPSTTLAPKRNKTDWIAVASSLHAQQLQMQEIPNYVDFSSYLLNSLSTNNTAIKFSYMQPNETFAPKLRGNFSVISFVIPHNNETEKNKGIFGLFSNFRLPWSRPSRDPSVQADTDVSQFPPLLEYFTQRIQAYFSVYKYTDESRVNNTIVVFAPGPEDFPETSVRVENDEFIETTELSDTQETTELSDTFETTEIFQNEIESSETFDENTEKSEETTAQYEEATEKYEITSELYEQTTETTESFQKAQSYETKESVELDNDEKETSQEENYRESEGNEV